MGFHRASHGLMMLFGIFLSYAMTQVVRSRTMKTLAWLSAPLLSWPCCSPGRAPPRSHGRGINLADHDTGRLAALRGILLSVFGMVVIAYVLSYFPDVYERVSFFRTGRSAVRAACAS